MECISNNGIWLCGNYVSLFLSLMTSDGVIEFATLRVKHNWLPWKLTDGGNGLIIPPCDKQDFILIKIMAWESPKQISLVLSCALHLCNDVDYFRLGVDNLRAWSNNRFGLTISWKNNFTVRFFLTLEIQTPVTQSHKMRGSTYAANNGDNINVPLKLLYTPWLMLLWLLEPVWFNTIILFSHSANWN